MATQERLAASVREGAREEPMQVSWALRWAKAVMRRPAVQTA